MKRNPYESKKKYGRMFAFASKSRVTRVAMIKFGIETLGMRKNAARTMTAILLSPREKDYLNTSGYWVEPQSQGRFKFRVIEKPQYFC